MGIPPSVLHNSLSLTYQNVPLVLAWFQSHLENADARVHCRDCKATGLGHSLDTRILKALWILQRQTGLRTQLQVQEQSHGPWNQRLDPTQLQGSQSLRCKLSLRVVQSTTCATRQSTLLEAGWAMNTLCWYITTWFKPWPCCSFREFVLQIPSNPLVAWRGRQKTKNLTNEYIMTDLISPCDGKDESDNAEGKIMVPQRCPSPSLQTLWIR